MSYGRTAFALLAAAALSACAAITQPARMVDSPSLAWRSVVTGDDSKRLRDWRKSFVDALARARKAGHGAEIDAEGALLQPDSALTEPSLPNGRYRCRVTKLGARSEGMLDYIAYPAFDCDVSAHGELQKLAKKTGSQRQVGLIYPDSAMREVFLGTLVLGDEDRATQYSRDHDRDVAGFIERVGPMRWRLLMPEPHYESRTDVMELVPAQ